MFRRSGSAMTCFVDGKVADPRTSEFAASLAEHRFRGIESAASEEISIGWVTAGDPTGDTFEIEDMDLDLGTWLRVRIDKKKLPTVWFKIHKSAAERSRGQKLSARESRELKLDLQSKLLPRVLPSVSFVDLLYDPKQKLVLVFTTSKRVLEELQKLFFKTFAARLVDGDPTSIATRVGLDRDMLAYLEQASPVRWPGAKTAVSRQPEPVPASAPLEPATVEEQR